MDSAPSISFILKKISNDKALALFSSIARSKNNRCMSLKGMNLSTKQYYSLISGLISAGLVKKEHGEYCLTSMGCIVHDANIVIGKAISYYWRIKAIESVQSSASLGLAIEYRKLLIDSLIDNHQIREILLKSFLNTEVFNDRLGSKDDYSTRRELTPLMA